MTEQRGFTLIELLVVVVLIAALLSFSLPRIKKAYENLQFQNCTRAAYYLARELQARAIAQRKVCCASLAGSPEGLKPGCMEEGALKEVADGSVKGCTLPAGMAMHIEPLGTKEVCFYPDGSIDPATLTFTDNVSGREAVLMLSKDAGGIQLQ